MDKVEDDVKTALQYDYQVWVT